jgi:preprotein translocase subunit SecG
MITVILVVHLLIAVSLVCVILLQKSEGGALGMGGGGMSGFMTGRSTANLLTRTTAVLALLFFVTSIGLAYLTANQRAQRSFIDLPAMAPVAPPASGTAAPVPTATPSAPAPSSTAPAPSEPTPAPSSTAPTIAPPAAPAAPAAPSAPLTK